MLSMLVVVLRPMVVSGAVFDSVLNELPIGMGNEATRIGQVTSRNIWFISVGPNGPPFSLLKATPVTVTVMKVLTSMTY